MVDALVPALAPETTPSWVAIGSPSSCSSGPSRWSRRRGNGEHRRDRRRRESWRVCAAWFESEQLAQASTLGRPSVEAHPSSTGSADPVLRQLDIGDRIHPSSDGLPSAL
jgi:hypothetical protein